MPMPKNTDGYACKFCGKTHTNRQGRFSHEKRCKSKTANVHELEIARLNGVIQQMTANAIVVAEQSSVALLEANTRATTQTIALQVPVRPIENNTTINVFGYGAFARNVIRDALVRN